MHIHAQKGDMECKFWILEEEIDIKEEFVYNLTPSGRKEIRKIIFQNFDCNYSGTLFINWCSSILSGLGLCLQYVHVLF